MIRRTLDSLAARRDERRQAKAERKRTEAMAMAAFARPGSAYWNLMAMFGNPAQLQREGRDYFGI